MQQRSEIQNLMNKGTLLRPDIPGLVQLSAWGRGAEESRGSHVLVLFRLRPQMGALAYSHHTRLQIQNILN